jgi:hypothetical protein
MLALLLLLLLPPICAVFTLFTSIALWLDSRFTATSGSSEAYTTAGRAVKAGLTACDIVSECPVLLLFVVVLLLLLL